jgi:hypothetical protein
MSDKFSRLEYFPNEIFIEIFQYFDGRNLFRSFYNLNSHFNILLHSLNNLSLSLSTSYYNGISIAPFIDILIIRYKTQTNLNNFTKLRRLFVEQLTDEFLEQLERNHLPYLEYLFIHSLDRIEEVRTSHLCSRIFSNGFPDLKSCCISKMNLITISLPWTQMLSLRILKIGDMDIFVYQSILSSCPNLYLLKFARIISNRTSTDVIRHVNLKKLIIAIPWLEELSEDCQMDKYLSCVPKLEEFIVHRTNEIISLNESFLKFDWYASLISLYLPLLPRFTYYFHILKSGRKIDPHTQNILNQIEEHFNRVHQYRFIIDFIG